VTESEDQGVDFREVDRVYAELKQRQESGDLTQEEFDEQLKQLMVQDKEARWWVKSRTTGEWHYYDGTTWIKDTPPGYEPIQAGPSTSPARAPTSPRTTLPRWLVPVASIGLVAFVGLMVIVVAIARNPGSDSDHAGDGGGSASNPTPTSSDPPHSAHFPMSHFSHKSGAWPQDEAEDAGNYNDDGGYRVYSPEEKTRVVPNLEAGPYQDVAVEVDAKVLNSQTDEIASGVVCRQQDPDNYYSMMVFVNGYVRIDKVSDAHFHKIGGGDRSREIGENVVSHHIRGDCIGNTLTLYVDDEKVGEAEDSEFSSGDVGLVVNSGNPDAGADILFDNFFVKKP
jgi:hypothetical protein